MMWFRKFSVIIYFFIASNFVFSQNCSCKTSKNELFREKFKSACFTGNTVLFEEAVSIIEKDSSVFCKQQVLYMRAVFSIYNSDVESCKKFLDQEKELLKENPCLENQALYYNAQANYYMHKGKLDSAINVCLKEQKIYEKLGNRANQATSLYNLSVVFSQIQQFDKQHFYLQKAIKLTPEISDITKRANLLSGIANGYAKLYEFHDKKPFLDTAFVFAKQAIQLTKNVKNTAYIKYKLLSIYELKAFKENDIKKSININKKRKLLLNPKFHIRDLYSINELLAQRYIYDKNYTMADKLLDSSKVYADKLNEQVSYSWYKTKYEVLKKLGKYNEALVNYEQYNQLNDSVQQKERFTKINELETKYQTELKDAEIDKLNQQEKIDALSIKNKQSQIKWLLALVTTALLFIMSLFFYFRQRSLKNKQKILQTEQRLNRARINPHFFFNAMASLQGIAQKEKSVKTTLYISRLAKIMRQSLESTYQEEITVEQEVDFLTQYLEIQKLRYPNKFNYEFHIDDNLEINELKLPGMLMQPFIENAIEHGFKYIDYQGKIDIIFKENKKQLMVIVQDNGKGLNLAQKEKAHKSRAMQIVNDRLHLFNKQNSSKAFYKIDNTLKKGFRIIVTLPKLY